MDLIITALLLAINFGLLGTSIYTKDLAITSLTSFGFIIFGLLMITQGLV